MKLRQLRRARPRLEQRTIIARHWGKPSGSKVWTLMTVEYELPDGRKGKQVVHPLGHKDPYDVGHTCLICGSEFVWPDDEDESDGGWWKRFGLR